MRDLQAIVVGRSFFYQKHHKCKVRKKSPKKYKNDQKLLYFEGGK